MERMMEFKITEAEAREMAKFEEFDGILDINLVISNNSYLLDLKIRLSA
jgi:hypothetical protein